MRRLNITRAGVHGVIMNHISKKSKTMSIQFESSFVLSAWTEKLKSGSIDYIKLRNGVMITIERHKLSIFNSNDLEENGSGVRFEDIPTRKDEAFDDEE